MRRPLNRLATPLLTPLQRLGQSFNPPHRPELRAFLPLNKLFLNIPPKCPPPPAQIVIQSTMEACLQGIRTVNQKGLPMPATLNAASTESVWDYPRPPRLELTHSYIRILHCGILLAETTRAFRVLETSHPPVYYIPHPDIAMHLLKPSAHRSSFCEFKGLATYWTVDLTLDPLLNLSASPHAVSVDAAWSYPQPSPAFADLRNHLAFYASRVDECTLDGERVTAQPGDFYGGWITSNITGPFKGPAGTQSW